MRPTCQIRATLPAPLGFLAEESNSSDAISTPALSLSRFPQPPRFQTLRETEREKAISLATIAPVTPPATPATIHYRGTSFDLVNPHASLPYHDIVTPSRDFDSSELLTLRSSQESQSSLFEVRMFSHKRTCFALTQLQMAHNKRPLYGDLNAAHAGIMRRAEDACHSSMLDLPLPPTPVAISPGSSTYTSPAYSPESHFAPSPLAVRKAPNDSHFSIKQLARTLTKRLTKPTEYGEEEELQQFRGSNTDGLSIATDMEPLRTLEQTYIPTERTSYFPISPVSPTSPTSPASLHDFGSVSGDEDEVEYGRRDSSQIYDSKGLASMVPDNPSTRVRSAEHPRDSAVSTDLGARPYYDDVASVYASSSVYTGDGHRRSGYQQSLVEARQSSGLLRYSNMGAAGMADEYSFDDVGRANRSSLRPATQELYHRPTVFGDGKTDTISKIIDQYDPENKTTSLASEYVKSVSTTSLIEPYTSDYNGQSVGAAPQPAAPVSGFSQFQFGLESSDQPDDGVGVSDPPQPTHVATRAVKYQAGMPPSGPPPPLAPAFQYEGAPKPFSRPDFSDMFSNGSHASYGDTRNLLQLRQSEVDSSSFVAHGLQPSSSYSQPDDKAPEASSSYSQPEALPSPQTPQEALDQAESIFDKAAAETAPSYDIPIMWGRQSPGNAPRSKRFTGSTTRSADNDGADWETVGGDSQKGRMSQNSLDSIADYSSSDGSRNSLGLTTAVSLRSSTKQDLTRGPSLYNHPSPIREHLHQFSSSPPRLAGPGSHTAPDVSAYGPPSSPPTSSTMPAFRFSDQPKRGIDDPYAFAPWTDLYAFSEKETHELLASGPNDDILIDSEVNDPSKRLSYKFKNHEKLPDSSSPRSTDTDAGLERENTFDKFTLVGPKGNLTGTPQGTGMHDAGSSVADNSSPGAKLSSSPRSDYGGFYASPFLATGSVTRIQQSQTASDYDHERTPSEITLFPGAYSMEPMQGSSPLAGPDGRRGLRCSTTFKPARRASRAAVPGQTKLRQMVLAPGARSTASSQDTQFSRFVGAGGSERPSTSNTTTPLHPTHPSLDTFPTIRSGHTIMAHQHSPHLLCPERKVSEEDEERRRKLSWLIFACFCVLPPCMFLYRLWGDSIIVSVTKGDLGHCTAKSKRAALIAGVVVNLGLITAILVPILVAQALKAI